MSDGYEGPIRVLAPDGAVLTTGTVALQPDPDHAGWKGLLQTLDGTAVAGKALVVQLEIPDGLRAFAQLIPKGETENHAISEVIGLGTAPF